MSNNLSKIIDEVRTNFKDNYNVDIDVANFEEDEGGVFLDYREYDTSLLDEMRHDAMIDEVRYENDGRSEYLHITSYYAEEDFI